jgi:DNA-binding response OmpR family regulator
VVIGGVVLGKIIIMTFSDSEENIINKVVSLLNAENAIESVCEVPTFLAKTLKFPSLSINLLYRTVISNGTNLDLTAREFDLLYFLASHPRQVFTLKQIYEGITQEEYHDTFRSVESSLYRLRKKLGNNYIENVRGYGYRFEPDAKG